VITRAVILLLATLAACAPREQARASVRNVTDLTGRVVAVPQDPRRVLSLCSSATDTVLRLGAGARLAGIDEFSRIVPGTAAIAVLGKGSALSREQVLARNIDLAFVWWYQEDAATLLESLGVPVVKIRCQRAAEIPATVRFVGQCLDLADPAAALAAGVEKDLALLANAPRPNPPAIYLELYSPFKTGGGESYVNDLIELAGGRNIAATATGSVLLSAEQLFAANPERVILLEGAATAGSFASRGGFDSLSAVHNHRVHILDRYAMVAGAGFPEGVARLKSLLANPPVNPAASNQPNNH